MLRSQVVHNGDVLRYWFTVVAVCAGLAACLPGCRPDSRPHGDAVGRESGRVFQAYRESTGPAPDLSAMRLHSDRPELGEARSAKMILEIDRASDMPILDLTAPTRSGPVSLVQIMGEVGLHVEVFWSDQLPPGLLVDDPWPGEIALQGMLEATRTSPSDDDRWYIHLLLGRKSQQDTEISMMVDTECGFGAVVFVDPDPTMAGPTLHAVVHEIGHLLHLPHPWEAYGNTRSAMTYPWRWSDWDWLDPGVFRFDAVGRRHILYGQTDCVRPGCDPEESAAVAPDG